MDNNLTTIPEWLLQDTNVAALVVAVSGAGIAAATTRIATLTTRTLKKQIVDESERNFIDVVITHPDGDHAPSLRDTRLFAEASARQSSSSRAAELVKKQVRVRLEEAIEGRERQETLAKWSRIASRILTFGQYIIGAMLTTSLAQDSLSKTWIGVFGLLVILCSATKQHFHVDENAQAADYRAKRLRSLVRYSQDQVAILEAKSVNGEDRTDAFVALMNEIRSSLDQIESQDIAYVTPKPLPATSEKN